MSITIEVCSRGRTGRGGGVRCTRYAVRHSVVPQVLLELAKLLVQAAKGAPANPEIRLHSAIALASQGARAAAEAELAEALKLSPALEKQADVQELKARLKAAEN